MSSGCDVIDEASDGAVSMVKVKFRSARMQIEVSSGM